jgi:hypothetical protein
MKAPRATLSICGLLIALVACAGFLVYHLRQNKLWKEEVSGLAAYQGVVRAKEDFQSGKLQLFVVVDERRGETFSGSNDGPFRVMPFSSHPFDYPSRLGAAKLVESYNRKMRSLHDHPERYIAGTNVEGHLVWK